MLSGIWMAVYGRPVWAQALCKLLEAEDCRAFLDEHMASIEFMLLRVDHGSTEDRFLEDVMDGRDGPGHDYSIWAVHADCVLEKLGLLQMCVICVVDIKCDAEDLEPKVSHTVVCHRSIVCS